MSKFDRRIQSSIGRDSSGSSSEMDTPEFERKGINPASPVKKMNDHDDGNIKVKSEVKSEVKSCPPTPENICSGNDGGIVKFNVDEIVDKYLILDVIGEGKFGKVMKTCNINTGETCALKILKNTDECRQAGIREVEMFKKLRALDPEDKKLWIKMLDCFGCEGHICIALELAGSSLYDFMKDNKWQPFTLAHTREIAYQICQAVKDLHDAFIVHTDLKPENICFLSSDFVYGIRSMEHTSFRQVKDRTIRIIDFGSAELCSFQLKHTYIQTRSYRSPEVVFGLGWSSSCDVWSIGCIMFELFHGFQLFPDDGNKQLADMMQEVLGDFPDHVKRHRQPVMKQDTVKNNKKPGCKPLREYMKAVPNNDHQQLFDLLGKMLQYIPERRITLAQALDDPFFKLCRAGIRY